MCKPKYIYSFIIIILIISVIGLLYFNSEFKVAKDLMKLYNSQDYQQIYAKYDRFFKRNDYEQILDKYYKSIFNSDTPQKAYELLQGRYAVALLHMHDFEQFERLMNTCAKSENIDYQRFLRIVWTITVEESNMLDDDTVKKVSDVFSSFEKENDNALCFHYFWNELFDLPIEESFKMSVINSGSYLSLCGDYIFILLTLDCSEKFQELYVQEYGNYPEKYDGKQETFLIQSNSLSNTQLEVLNESLELLKKEYENRNDPTCQLKIKIILQIQQQIVLNNTGDVLA